MMRQERRDEIGPDMTYSGDQMCQWLALNDKDRRDTIATLIHNITQDARDIMTNNPRDIDLIVWLCLIAHIYRTLSRDYGREETIALFASSIIITLRQVIYHVMEHETDPYIERQLYREFARDALFGLRNFDLPIDTRDIDLRRHTVAAIRAFAKDLRQIAYMVEELAATIEESNSLGADVCAINKFIFDYQNYDWIIESDLDSQTDDAKLISNDLNIWRNVYLALYMLGHRGYSTIRIPMCQDSVCELFPVTW